MADRGVERTTLFDPDAETARGGGGKDRSRSMADAAGKAQAAREVCAASAAFASCPHRRRRPPFVDWYLVLAVSEAASEDAIRRRYRQLALQLHPDKNRHPKAEVAFKIVAEAHACLTDKARRRAFDAERSASLCTACHQRARHRTTDRRTAPASNSSSSNAQQAQQALREAQNRLREECRVIESCLRANDAGARRRQSFPLFDPSDRHRFPDYPHTRPPPSLFADCRPTEFWPFEDHLGVDQKWCRGGGRSCESPVYQIRTAPERTARTKPSWR